MFWLLFTSVLRQAIRSFGNGPLCKCRGVAAGYMGTNNDFQLGL
jgi:hypothetical protein